MKLHSGPKYRNILPSDLLRAHYAGIKPQGEVAVDTETSGLFVDDGARCSTVSIAFGEDTFANKWADFLGMTDASMGEMSHVWDGGIYSYGAELVDKDTKYYRTVVSFAWPVDQGVANSGKKEDTGYATMWPDADNLSEAEWRALLEWLSLVGAEHGLVYHHAKFDLHILEAGSRRWPGIGACLDQYTVWDTQNVCSLIYPTSPLVPRHTTDGLKYLPTTSLKPTAAHLWGEHETDEQDVIKRYLRKHKLPTGRWDLMPWDVISKYAEEDARKTIRLMWKQQFDIRAGNAGQWLDGKYGMLTASEAIQRRLNTSLFLKRMERRGLPFNVKKSLKIAQKLERIEATIEAQLPFKPTLPAAKDYWFTEAGLDLTPYSTTDKGAPQINEAIINKMIKAEVPYAKEWRDLQKVRTANERWYSGYASMAGSDGRLRASFRQNGTVSGRFSVERVQVQAIPHDYRLDAFDVLDGIPTPRALIAAGVPKGWRLWELDLQQAELRVAAFFAKCVTMLRLIDEGADLHAVTAQELFNISPDDPLWGKMRTIAKRSNFGLIFGSGAETFKADLEKQTGIVITLAEANRIVRGWNDIYPEFRRAIADTQRRVERRMGQPDYGRGVGWIGTHNGERRWWVPGEDTHKGFNQRVQPNLAQFGMDWWMDVDDRMMEHYGDEPIVENGEYVGRVGVVLSVHDSIGLLIKDGDEHLIDWSVQRGVDLWEERFPGLPGGVDAKEWGKA